MIQFAPPGAWTFEDFSALRWLRGKLDDSDRMEMLDMIADPDDPRDLFGMILRAASWRP